MRALLLLSVLAFGRFLPALSFFVKSGNSYRLHQRCLTRGPEQRFHNGCGDRNHSKHKRRPAHGNALLIASAAANSGQQHAALQDPEGITATTTTTTLHHQFRYKILSVHSVVNQDSTKTTKTTTLLLPQIVDLFSLPSSAEARAACRYGEFVILRKSHRVNLDDSSNSKILPLDAASFVDDDDDDCSRDLPALFLDRILLAVEPWTPAALPDDLVARITRVVAVDDKDTTTTSTAATTSVYPVHLTGYILPPPAALFPFDTRMKLQHEQCCCWPDDDKNERAVVVVYCHYQDDDIAVVHKPAGLPTVGSARRRDLESALPFLLRPPVPLSSSSSVVPSPAIDSNANGAHFLPRIVAAAFAAAAASGGQLRHHQHHQRYYDRDAASGLVVVAKTARALQQLLLQPAFGGVYCETYTALVFGNPLVRPNAQRGVPPERSNSHGGGSASCATATEKNENNNKSITPRGTNHHKNGDDHDGAGWNCRVLQRGPVLSMLEIQPTPLATTTTPAAAAAITSRLSSIRRHLSHGLGTPIVGDDDDDYYGTSTTAAMTNNKFKGRGLRLCCNSVTFDHPATGKRVTFAIPVPEDFQELLLATTNADDDGNEAACDADAATKKNASDDWLEQVRAELGQQFTTDEGRQCTGEPSVDPSRMINPNQGDSEWVDDW